MQSLLKQLEIKLFRTVLQVEAIAAEEAKNKPIPFQLLPDLLVLVYYVS